MADGQEMGRLGGRRQLPDGEGEREKGRKTAKKRGLEVRGGKNRLEILRVPKEKGMHSVVNRTLKALT